MAVGLQSLLRTVVDNKASGLHIRGNSNAYVRLNGLMKPIDDSFLPNDEVKKMAYACMGERERKIFEQYSSVDFSLDAKSYGRFRFNVFRQMGKICMAIRHIPLKIPTFEDFHLPGDVLKKIADNRRGLILVTGMTGSGKTSTLAAMVVHLGYNLFGVLAQAGLSGYCRSTGSVGLLVVILIALLLLSSAFFCGEVARILRRRAESSLLDDPEQIATPGLSRLSGRAFLPALGKAFLCPEAMLAVLLWAVSVVVNLVRK